MDKKLELTEAERQWRTRVVAAVALAYPVGQAGFELGAFGELSFSHKLVAWTAVTATFIALTVIPRKFLNIPRWQIWVLCIPSLWMLGRFAMGMTGLNPVTGPIFYVAGIVSFIICFPFAIYIVVRIANPDLADIRGLKSWLPLLAIGVLFFSLGYLIGTWNQLLISCQEARIGRIELPDHCRRD